MNDIEARSAQLVRKVGKKDVTHVQTLNLELSPSTAERIGRAFGVISVETKERKGAALAAHIEDAFSRACDDAVRALPPEAQHDQVFEAAIGGVNKALVRLFGEYGLDLEPEIVTSAIVACRDADMVVAVWGRPSALLFHPANSGVRILDLVGDGAEKEPQPFRSASTLRCYGSVIAGRIGPRDRLLVATHDLRRYADDALVAEAVLARDPVAASEALDKILPLAEGVTVASLVLDASPFRYLENQPFATTTPQPLMRAEESRTKPAIAALFGPQAIPETPIRAVETAPFPAAPNPSTPARSPLLAFAPLIAFTKTVFRAVRAAFHKETRQALLADIDGAVAKSVTRYNNLAPLSKAMLLGALLLAMLAQGSVAVSAVGRAREDRVAAYERRLEDIGRTIDSAEASMIYRDEVRAKELLDEAVAAIALLPLKTEEEQAKKIALEAKIVEARATMRKEVPLTDPQTIATIAGDAGQASALVFDGTSLWTATTSGSVLRVSPNGDATDAAGKAALSSLLVANANGGALAIGPDGVIMQFGKTAKSAKVDIGDESLTEAAIYSGRLYVLDAAHNRIMRHIAAADGYGAGQHYLKDGTDLSGAVSMAIDNSVWTLKPNGTIVRVMQGKQEPFTASQADPAVTNARKVRTPSEIDDLFILDSAPSRILRFDKKTGSLIAQYVSPKLDGATDFAVEKGGKNAFVTVGSTVLKFDLQTK